MEPNGNPEYEPGSTRFYMYPTYPEYDLVESSRCGRDHMAHAGDTDILPVKAGDDFEVAVTGQYPDAVVAGESWGAGWLPPYTYWEGCYEGRGICRGDAYDGVVSATPLTTMQLF